MENNEIMVNANTGELIDNQLPENPLSNVPTVSIEQFRHDAFRGNLNELAKWANEDGNTDAILHAGHQLKTKHVLNHVLTIITVQYAHVPGTEDERKLYPVVVFAEAPEYWYNMGQLGGKLISDWCKHTGDDPMEDPYLPNLNQMLSDCGGVRIHFRMKHSSATNRDYVSITVA